MNHGSVSANDIACQVALKSKSVNGSVSDFDLPRHILVLLDDPKVIDVILVAEQRKQWAVKYVGNFSGVRPKLREKLRKGRKE